VHPVAATLTALAIPPLVLVIYVLVSNYDWRAPGTNPAAPDSGTMASVEAAVASLEGQLQADPANEEGWILLGSSYLSLNRPTDAANAYQRALELSGGRNTAARLGVAEARIVLDPASLAGPAGDDIEAVLAVEPRNPKGLWYGGLLSLARGQPALARERWEALLQLSPPEQVREVIESQLAQIDFGVTPGAESSPAPSSPAAPAAAPSDGIGVTVSLSEALRARVSPSAPLFVFVRDAQAGGPPLAVIRRQADELPVTLRITDADIMLPGRSLASVELATVVARIANGGDPIAKPGDVYGEAGWQRGGDSGPVTILINQVVAP
jgi:cytochrome c-type biogenesis protein CcmH